MRFADSLSPRRWSEVFGNRDIKRYFAGLNKNLRAGHLDRMASVSIQGGRRQGKTSGARLGIESLHCKNPDPTTYDPCGSCYYCRERVSRHGANGEELFYRLDSAHDGDKTGPIHTAIVNGPELNRDHARDLVDRVRAEWSPVQFVWIDEAMRIPLNGLEYLLSEMDQLPVVWIATSTVQGRVKNKTTRATDDEAIGAFWKRFPVKLKTQAPGRSEFARYLDHIGNRTGVQLDGDGVHDRVFDLTGGVPGEGASYVLSAASINNGRLTKDFVERHAKRAA